MNIRKVKGNFDRIFDKTLTDLVRGIRNNKENEVKNNIVVVVVVNQLEFYSNTDQIHSAMY